MALFGGRRDTFLLDSINNELLNDIISQQVAFYKQDIKNTNTNIYGESSKEKFYYDPILISCLINKNPQEFQHVEEGVSFNRTLEIAFYTQHLMNASLYPEIGDVILFEETFYEVAGLVNNQFFLGKDPEFTYDNEYEGEEIDYTNPLNPGLGNFGKNISVVCKVNYIPEDKVGIKKIRM